MGTNYTVQSVFEELAGITATHESNESRIYRIGDLAKDFNISLRTLRFYEDRGLISPRRTGSTRIYSAGDRDRLKLILLIKSAGFSLIDIQELLKLYDEGDAQTGIEMVVEKFNDQLEKLHFQREEVSQSIENLQTALERVKEHA